MAPFTTITGKAVTTPTALNQLSVSTYGNFGNFYNLELNKLSLTGNNILIYTNKKLTLFIIYYLIEIYISKKKEQITRGKKQKEK